MNWKERQEVIDASKRRRLHVTHGITEGGDVRNRQKRKTYYERHRDEILERKRQKKEKLLYEKQEREKQILCRI